MVIRNRQLQSEKSLKYYYKNKEIVIKKQITYKRFKYLSDKRFKKIDDIRKNACHNIPLKDKKCNVCGTTSDLQRHHEDYSRPLEIIILCRKCHNKLHQDRKNHTEVENKS